MQTETTAEPAAGPQSPPAGPAPLNIRKIALARGITAAELADRLGVGLRLIYVLNRCGLASETSHRTKLTLDGLASALGMTRAEAEVELRAFVELGVQHRAAKRAESAAQAPKRKPRPSQPTLEQVKATKAQWAARGAALDGLLSRKGISIQKAAGMLGVSNTMLFKLRRAGFRLASEPGRGKTAEEIEQALGFERGALSRA